VAILLIDLLSAKVIGQHKIRAVITDPPYGVAYVENKKGLSKLGVKEEKQSWATISRAKRNTRSSLANTSEPSMPYLEEYNAVYIFNADLMFPSLRWA
jgi:tRNA G10  N-methylase Trm11